MIPSIIIGLLVAGYLFIKHQVRQSAIRYLMATYYLDPKKLKPLKGKEISNLRHTLESLRKKDDWVEITKHAEEFK